MARRGGKKDPIDQFWGAVESQKMDTLRWTLSNCNNLFASTQNEDGLTSFMVAASRDKWKSMQMLIDFYSRQKELRDGGWLECQDEQGKTALMYAAETGSVKCTDFILDAQPQGRGDRKSLDDTSYAKSLVAQKDKKGLTALEHATRNKKQNVVDIINDFLAPPVEVADDAKKGPEGVSSTLLSKQKKRALMEEAGGDAFEKAKGQERVHAQRMKEEEEASKAADAIKSRKALWPEVRKVDESAEKTSKICEITVTRSLPTDDCPANGDAANPCDPALWDLVMLNRLSLRLPKDVLTSLPKAISRLSALQILIVSHNALTSLPDEIGDLGLLKVLEAENNQLQALPASIGKCSKLEVVKVGGNMLTSLAGLEPLKNLTIVSAAANRLRTLENIPFKNLPRLSELSCPKNAIDEIPEDISQCPVLAHVTLNNNKITEVPSSIIALKKVKDLDLSENPLSDNKVKKYLELGGKGIKDLWKYLEKNAKKGGGKKKKKKVVESEEEDED